MPVVPDIAFEKLAERYDVILFDAYGVLVHGSGIMPGAREALALLARIGKPYYVVTNDASRLPAASARRYAQLGLALDPARIITSGLLLRTYFFEHALQGARCAVLGPRDGVHYVEQAGGRIVAADGTFDVLVICDESGFPFLPTIDAALTALVRQIDSGRIPRLLLPNPDLIYPEGTDAFGFAAGSVALMFEAALARRYPGQDNLRFVPLGKPEPHLFHHALALAGTRNAVMIGDQLETDIAGASAAGIDSALLTAGVTRLEAATAKHALRPTYRLSKLTA